MREAKRHRRRIRITRSPECIITAHNAMSIKSTHPTVGIFLNTPLHGHLEVAREGWPKRRGKRGRVVREAEKSVERGQEGKRRKRDRNRGTFGESETRKKSRRGEKGRREKKGKRKNIALLPLRWRAELDRSRSCGTF